ncbi:Serine/threonine-protein kinase DCLK [Penicillium camemberti]|uniref:non-specific serine/threonine protein kinase n=1 Tax=Penicillium camemberti (strain FM 013) TaxID=1429867 RepID=A0A0G4P8E7_PENC3|nr:Serine/threonine-protein kinase DCLK [Penicillium camemberti]
MWRLGGSRGRFLERSFFKRPFFQRPPSPVRQFTQSNIQPLDSNLKFEEETHPGYKAEDSYSVQIGEVFQSRYQVIGKLGFGGYSTVWLCKDLTQHKYLTLKVLRRDSAEGKREIAIYDRINAVKTSHAGAMLVRTALDTFQIDDAKGSYQVIVHQPLGIRLYDLRHRFTDKILPEKAVKLTLMHLLLALDYLHTEAGIVHTDIQEKNIMLGIEDESLLAEFEEGEKSNPSPRKVVGNRVIYASRELKTTDNYGRPVLCDFGQGRFGSAPYSGDIQPYIYRAPEILLRTTWDEKVDIWNLAVLTWNIFQREPLFYAKDSKKEDSNAHHIAEVIAVLGLPPREILLNNDYATEFFDSEGNWKGAVPIPSTTLEQREEILQGEPQQLFLAFMRKMLQWRPEERSSAKELLADQWLLSP